MSVPHGTESFPSHTQDQLFDNGALKVVLKLVETPPELGQIGAGITGEQTELFHVNEGEISDAEVVSEKNIGALALGGSASIEEDLTPTEKWFAEIGGGYSFARSDRFRRTKATGPSKKSKKSADPPLPHYYQPLGGPLVGSTEVSPETRKLLDDQRDARDRAQAQRSSGGNPKLFETHLTAIQARRNKSKAV